MKRFDGTQISMPHATMLELKYVGKLNLGMVNEVDEETAKKYKKN